MDKPSNSPLAPGSIEDPPPSTRMSSRLASSALVTRGNGKGFWTRCSATRHSSGSSAQAGPASATSTSMIVPNSLIPRPQQTPVLRPAGSGPRHSTLLYHVIVVAAATMIATPSTLTTICINTRLDSSANTKRSCSHRSGRSHRQCPGPARLRHRFTVAGPLWVISGHMQCKTACPLYPRKRTLHAAIGMSAKCQKRTLMQRSKRDRSSITSSARASSAGARKK